MPFVEKCPVNDLSFFTAAVPTYASTMITFTPQDAQKQTAHTCALMRMFPAMVMELQRRG